MDKINKDIFRIADKAKLQISTGDKSVDIKHKLHFDDKSTWGLLLFLGAGLFLIVAPFIKTSDFTTKGLGIVFGLLLVILSILTIIRRVADRLSIKNGILLFRHNLKLTIIPLDRALTVKMKTEILKIKRTRTLGSDFILVTHILQDNNIETPILKFQMDNSEADNAKKLGNELTYIINEKLNSNKTSRLNLVDK